VRTRNIDIQSGRSSVQQVKALKGAAVEWGRTSVEWMGGQYNAYEFDNAFTVKQSIPWLGTISKGHDLHSERLRRSELQADITVRDVMASTERAFDRIAYAREILRLADTLRGVLSRTARAADLRTRLGESATLERVSAQSQLSELIAKLSEYEADLRRAESTLQILCNDVLITTSDTILRQRPLPEDTSTATVLVDAARAAVSTAKAEADLAASYAWPNFNVGYSNQSLTGAVMPDGSIATGDNRFHVAFVAVDVPLIFGPVSARSEQAELNVDLAERERNAALHTIDLRRRQLMLEISAYAATLEHYNGPAQEEVRILVDHGTRAYEAGEISWLELRQALEQAVRLRINRLDALLRYNDAVISLELLTKD
jgi:heavy metal efflux system protein